MSIQLVTYANQTVTPTNDAIIYERAIDQNGIFYGCNVTVTSNTVNITGGYGIVCGREFVINSESISVTLAPSGTLDGRLYVRLDLADADAPIQLLTATGNTLPALEQDDDVNYTNGVYEMELATFTVGMSALSDVVETFETIKGTKEVDDSKSSQVTIQYSSAVSSPFVYPLLIRGNILYVTIGGNLSQTAAWTNTDIATINGATASCDANVIAMKNDGTSRLLQIVSGSGTMTLRNLDNTSADNSFRAFLSIPIDFT